MIDYPLVNQIGFILPSGLRPLGSHWIPAPFGPPRASACQFVGYVGEESPVEGDWTEEERAPA